ncbi:CotS family spore coat protein [Clostridium paraputrificum]|uniref:CotS family spore coat protein n=1 Tax=Clostridium TaxID=1485 RepID=UPI003D3448C9
MNKLRYPDKKYLLDYDLSSEFFNKLGINVLDITPLRKVFILQTDEGKMILKRVEYSEDRLRFINSCVENIYDKFSNIISFRKFDSGKCYIDWKGNNYIVMDLIPGREVTFTNPLEFQMSGELLARMHLASKNGFKEILKEIGKAEGEVIEESMVIKLDNSLEDIKKIRSWVEKYRYKNEFDELFLEVIDKYVEEIDKSKELLSFSGYSSYREEMKNIVVCHNDLAEHNFLISEDEMYLIDFDYCSIDLRIMDLADLVLKGIKNAAFDIDKALDVINAYDKVYPLDREEYKFLYILLLYPRDFYSIVRSYYHREKDWEEEVFLNRIKNKLSNEVFRRDFLEAYKRKYKEMFC